jgi:hypothetical protein
MHTYFAYGLTIHSGLPLPELQPSDATQADVTIQIRSERDFASEPDCPETELSSLPGGVRLLWKQIGQYTVLDGKTVCIDRPPGVQDRELRLPLLGSVISMLLTQRGFLVLHASAINVNGRAAVFVGQKGQGKSTMAATLYQRGHHLLSDDVVAVDLSQPGQPRVVPGFPQFKLWPDAVTHCLQEDPTDLPQVHGLLEKRSRLAFDRFSPDAIPLDTVYVLGSGETVAIQSLTPQMAIAELLTHSYAARFGKDFLQGQLAAHHFQQCMHLAQQIPILGLERPRDIAQVPQVAHLVEHTLSKRHQILQDAA